MDRILVMFLLWFVLISCEKKPDVEKKHKQEIQHKFLYNIIIDSLDIENGLVESGETISDILLRNGISHQDIHFLTSTFDSVYNFKKIIPKHKWCILREKNSTKNEYFIYEIDKLNFVVVKFDSSIVGVYLDRKPVKYKEKKASGIILSSLWNCMMKENLPPELIMELSEIFAWTVNFFGIQKGDKFKVIYDEIYTGNEFIGIGNIYAAYFYHNNENLYAFKYKDEEIEGYYDEEGKNLKREFLKAPLKFSRISSGFSNSRLHPILKVRRPHHGIDYAAPIGTPVRAIGNGRVIHKGYSGGAGRMIKIKHSGSFVSAYLHLSKYAKGIRRGTNVSQGQTIGYVGSSGLSTGPHLDFRMYLNGRAVNPLRINAKPLKPLDSMRMEQFKIKMKNLKSEIDSIDFKNTS